VHKGDLIEAVNGQPILAMPDWFVARAHFESNVPVHLEVMRNGHILKLQVVLERGCPPETRIPLCDCCD